MLRSVSSDGSSSPRSTWLSIETLMPARSDTVASVRLARVPPPPDRSAELAAHQRTRIRFIHCGAPCAGRLFAGCHFSLPTMHATIVA